MRTLPVTCILGLSLLFAACGDEDAPAVDAGHVDAGGDVDAGPSDDAGPALDAGPSEDAGPAVDAGPLDDAGPALDAGTTDDAGPSVDGGAMVTLTVQNYLAWCSVSVAGGAASPAAIQTITVPVGTVVALDASALAGFVWGYWFGTDGDTSAAHDTTMTTMVTVDADMTVQACCPFPPPAAATCPAP